jgi:hypothetical protein
MMGFLCNDADSFDSIRARPNIMVEWLALLLRIPEVSCSNLELEASCPDGGFSCSYSVPPGKCRDSALIRQLPLPSTSFIRRSIIWSTESDVK